MIANYLKNLKEKSKMTSKQICEISKVPESTFSRILSGETPNPNFQTVQALVYAMGGSLDEITNAPQSEKNNSITTVVDIYKVAYDNAVEDRSYWRKFAMVVLVLDILLTIALVALFTYDIMNGNIGWFRYATSHFRDAVSSLLGDMI